MQSITAMLWAALLVLAVAPSGVAAQEVAGKMTWVPICVRRPCTFVPIWTGPKLEDGAPCSVPVACQSGVCHGHHCVGSTNGITCYADVDGDAFGADVQTFVSIGYLCPEGLTFFPGDCDDNDVNVHPGATEMPGDGIDQNCADDIVHCFPDLDNDGFGSSTSDSNIYITPDAVCPPGSAPTMDDCDDASPVSFPGAEEICDCRNNDCDLWIDEGLDIDNDEDGWYREDSCYFTCHTWLEDCDDENPAIHPLAEEIYGDGIDQDCLRGWLGATDQWNGTPCDFDDTCQSGICSLGICCNHVCYDDGCYSCGLQGYEGFCIALSQDTVCRPSRGPCDIAETCDGYPLWCPNDRYLEATLCNSVDGSLCTGDSPYCPSSVDDSAYRVYGEPDVVCAPGE